MTLYSQDTIGLAEVVAKLFPGSTIKVNDVASEFVPKDYVGGTKQFDNGSTVVLEILPF